MATRIGWICSIGLAASVSACNGVDINRLDASLMDAYRVKLTELDAETKLFVGDGIRACFAEIAQQAEKGAGKLGDDEKLNKTSLYRITATALWQSLDLPFVVENFKEPKKSKETDSEEPGDKEVTLTLASTFAYTSKAGTLCDSEWQKGRKVKHALPRDCLLVKIIPDIAGNDGAALKYEAARESLAAAADEGDPEKKKNTVQAALDDYRSAYATMRGTFVAMTNTREANLSEPVPLDFWRWADQQRLRVYCATRGVSSVFGDIDVPELSDGTKTCIIKTRKGMTEDYPNFEKRLIPSFRAVESDFEAAYCKKDGETEAAWVHRASEAWEPESIKPGAVGGVAETDFNQLPRPACDVQF